MRTGGEVYVWQVMFLLLRRSHGFELAVRHEAELRTLLGRKGPEVDVSPCVAAALATIRWMVEGEVVRHRVFRTPTMAQIPLEEWSRCSSENIPLRAFILCSAELRTRWCKPVQDNDMLSAVPLLVAWVSDIIVQEYGTVAAARLCYVFLKDFPHLSSLVEFLGIFLMALGEEPVGLRGNGAMPCRGVAERAWLFASFLSAWPPWAEASGLKTAVDGFLSELGNVSSQMSCDGAGRLRESPPSASDLLVNKFQPSADVCCAVQALVEACESQSKHCGPFPLSRAKDFFLQRPVDKGAVDIRKDVVFRAVSEDCELIIVC
uniref:WGS project CAEQ00000000 data, annotated contig 512 n=1 Tax=Trypanosoma congolense (strain IL3000) TaxID=1068625 RepID=F9WGK6_TRYCI|nr:unnamed protein product [Trypanosoma congolense IL3000]